MTLKAIKFFTSIILLLGLFYNHSIYAAKNHDDQATLSWLMAVDKSEINAAKLALKKTKNADVKNYAEEMVNDHQQNLKDIADLMKKLNLKTTENSEIKSFNQASKKELGTLKKLKDKDFDKTYITSMVSDHGKVLQKLDTLISSASASIVDYLKATRDTVSAHLDKAKDIQKNLS